MYLTGPTRMYVPRLLYRPRRTQSVAKTPSTYFARVLVLLSEFHRLCMHMYVCTPTSKYVYKYLFTVNTYFLHTQRGYWTILYRADNPDTTTITSKPVHRNYYTLSAHGTPST